MRDEIALGLWLALRLRRLISRRPRRRSSARIKTRAASGSSVASTASTLSSACQRRVRHILLRSLLRVYSTVVLSPRPVNGANHQSHLENSTLARDDSLPRQHTPVKAPPVTPKRTPVYRFQHYALRSTPTHPRSKMNREHATPTHPSPGMTPSRRQTIQQLSPAESAVSPHSHDPQAHSSRDRNFAFAVPAKRQSTHARSMSLADVARQGKRLSLNFPVQTPLSGHASARQSPSMSPLPTPSSSPDITTFTPTSGNSFLTALAAQERRVLELKEELLKAEQHLTILKKQWAAREATKKREDIHHIQKLQPLNTGLADFTADRTRHLAFNSASSSDEDLEDSSSWLLQREMERRRLMLNTPRSAQRKVFSGSRHTRTLSLLSPERSEARAKNDFDSPTVRLRDGHSRGGSALSRSNTTSGLWSAPPTAIARRSLDIGPDVTNETLINTGRRMATDLKDNLWTFIDDLRQVTVGDEGQNVSNARRNMGSRPPTSEGIAEHHATGFSTSPTSFPTGEALRQSQKSPSEYQAYPSPAIAESEQESSVASQASTFAVRNPRATMAQTPGSVTASSTAGESDSLDSSPRTSTSSSNNAPLGLGMPRTIAPRQDSAVSSNSTPTDLSACSSHSKRDSIPWPDIIKLAPSTLTRTASNLMNEWEKSISIAATPTRGPASPVGSEGDVPLDSPAL